MNRGGKRTYATPPYSAPRPTHGAYGWWHVAPNQQRTLSKLPTELRRRNFVNKRRLSMQIGTQTCENTCATCTVFRLSFHFAYHRCWLGRTLYSAQGQNGSLMCWLCAGPLEPEMPGFPVIKMPNPPPKMPNLKLYLLSPENLNAKQ